MSLTVGNFVDVTTARDPQAHAKLLSERNEYQDVLRQKAQSPLSVVTARSLDAAAKAPACSCQPDACACAGSAPADMKSECAAAAKGCCSKSPGMCSRREGCSKVASPAECCTKSPGGCSEAACPAECCTERSQRTCCAATDRQE